MFSHLFSFWFQGNNEICFMKKQQNSFDMFQSFIAHYLNEHKFFLVYMK